MPNWCECDLAVHGKTEDVQRLKQAVKDDGEVLSADRIIPYPEDFRLLDKAGPQNEAPASLSEEAKAGLATKGFDLTRDGFNQGGYEWCLEHWGTKWGFCGTTVDDADEWKGETTLIYRFQCAWSPPIPLIKRLGEMFPRLTLELRYFEAGMGFHGLFRVEDGVEVEHKQAEYFGDRGG